MDSRLWQPFSRFRGTTVCLAVLPSPQSATSGSESGIAVGWMADFRHSTSTRLRKDGIHPRVVSAILGHSRVQLALDVYDHCDRETCSTP